MNAEMEKDSNYVSQTAKKLLRGAKGKSKQVGEFTASQGRKAKRKVQAAGSKAYDRTRRAATKAKDRATRATNESTAVTKRTTSGASSGTSSSKALKTTKPGHFSRNKGKYIGGGALLGAGGAYGASQSDSKSNPRYRR